MLAAKDRDILYNIVLKRLGIPSPTAPDLTLLTQIMARYRQNVPWETVSRVVRTHTIERLNERPRNPQDFWNDFLSYGTGGTCFESNYALYDLLLYLRFEAYLTFCSVDNNAKRHSAIVALANSRRKCIVDVGWWTDCPLLVSEDERTINPNKIWDFSVTPLSGSSYQVMRLSRAGAGPAYVLHDAPIDSNAYFERCVLDYGPSGLFLDRIIVSQLKGSALLRFDLDSGLERMDKTGVRRLAQAVLVQHQVPSLFGIHPSMFWQALRFLGPKQSQVDEKNGGDQK